MRGEIQYQWDQVEEMDNKCNVEAISVLGYNVGDPICGTILEPFVSLCRNSVYFKLVELTVWIYSDLKVAQLHGTNRVCSLMHLVLKALLQWNLSKAYFKWDSLSQFMGYKQWIYITKLLSPTLYIFSNWSRPSKFRKMP